MKVVCLAYDAAGGLLPPLGLRPIPPREYFKTKEWGGAC